jgi:PAS domain S-box-containing protein
VPAGGPLSGTKTLGLPCWARGLKSARSGASMPSPRHLVSSRHGLVTNLYSFTAKSESELTLHRASGDGEAPVLIVAPAGEYPAREAVRRLEHEYHLRAALDNDWAARPVALAPRGGRMALVLEDPGGVALDRLLGRPLEVTQFLRIAIPVVAAIHQMHARGLIHKDIKPANVLVDTSRGRAWLTGFGIASRLPREHRAPEPPEVIAGTLAYMAPEQTGRMNRSVDSRSDLYALGVTFYEMLTGTLPFTAADPMEWVHCHIARQPVPPDERVAGVPGRISAIVMKLLAKTAEGRYQTAAGLAIDLRRCLLAWEATGRIDPFPLGTEDASDRLVIPERLYGREREIDTLVAAFDRVVAVGTPALVLVSGFSGIGKSSLVNELHRVLVPPRGLFAAGKFDQHAQDIPYATLAQAFQSLVRHILTRSDAEVRRWRDAMCEALGPNGQLIVNLIPEVELLIGKQPTLPELAPQDAQNRFQLVFRRFIAVFARPEHPLALFLDDLQWLDAATLTLLADLVTRSEVGPLLLVGAYRDNEVGPSHPLMPTLGAIRGAGAPVHDIVLAPLGVADVGRLVADALHCRAERAEPLAELVHEKTGGNPFFTIQFLMMLGEERLLIYDARASDWTWDVHRIRAKGYTDNVVELVVGKLNRLSDETREALKELACLGNAAEIAVLDVVHGQSEQPAHDGLWEGVRAGLIFQQDGVYRFLHDRIQQAAYSLIPEEHRGATHLRIGRALLAGLTADALDQHLFDVASQFNRAISLIADRDEKAQVATLNLRAGRRAKASAAHASARVYLEAGMDLLDEEDWSGRYELTFSLWLERAECEFLTSHFETAERLIEELQRRGATKIDKAAASHLEVQLHVVKSDNPRAVASALGCLRLFDIDIPPHPTWEQVQAEYEAVWRNLDGRPIEDLIDLPPMTDPERLAAMRLLSDLTESGHFTDIHLSCLHLCRMVNITIRHGICGASAHACGFLGFFLGPSFGRYAEGDRFARLACELVEKRGFTPFRAMVHLAMGLVSAWTQPLTRSLDFTRSAFRTATETGEFTSACYSVYHIVKSLLLRNDPLDAVWDESQRLLAFARRAGFRDFADMLVSQQRFVATMQGRTASFSTFSDAEFDERAFEAQLTADRMAFLVSVYWILKLEARYLSGDYAEALAAARKAKEVIWAQSAQILLVDYFCYTALTVAALYEKASPDEQTEWRELLAAHRRQLMEWAESYPPTFGHKLALVSAEIARLEGRDPAAMRLYEEAIRSARTHGFVRDEGLAHEVAARFYATRRFDTIADVYLRSSVSCFVRAGAEGKSLQIQANHPRLRDSPGTQAPTTTFGATVEQLDIGAVAKASQAISGEIVLDRLVETLMTIALQHAGAERGLLLVLQGGTPRIAAAARTDREAVEVTLRQELAAASDLPLSLLQTVIRTRQSVILEDASAPNPFSADDYFRQKRARSVLCLPLIKQAELIGALYLENNLAPHVFTPARLSVLNLLSSQAAISLENARLYAELIAENRERQTAESALRTSEERWRNLFENAPVGIALTGSNSHYVATNPAFQRMTGYSEAELRLLTPADITHEEDRAGTDALVAVWRRGTVSPQRIEKRYRGKDGGVVWAEVSGFLVAPAAGSTSHLAAVVVDVTDRKRAEDDLHEVQAELAHVARITTMGEMAASIAHEVNQPLSGVVLNANASLRWLARDPPNVPEARDAVEAIIRDGKRASEVVARIRTLLKKSGAEKEPLDLNEVMTEVAAFAQGELRRASVALRPELAPDLPRVTGDRVQLQQVVLNLVLNAIDAMRTVSDRPRELAIETRREGDGHVRVAVCDVGIGVAPENIGRLFNAFYTTKPGGMGMGLSICRSIIENHGGRLWGAPNEGPGTTFFFVV